MDEFFLAVAFMQSFLVRYQHKNRLLDTYVYSFIWKNKYDRHGNAISRCTSTIALSLLLSLVICERGIDILCIGSLNAEDSLFGISSDLSLLVTDPGL